MLVNSIVNIPLNSIYLRKAKSNKKKDSTKKNDLIKAYLIDLNEPKAIPKEILKYMKKFMDNDDDQDNNSEDNSGYYI